MPTIHEVAKLSGVSVATVSRVLNGHNHVREETRQRVLATARKLDYAPSAAARTLVKQRSQLIGVILFTGEEHPDLQHPFFLEVLVGLKHSLGAEGYDLMLFAREQPGVGRGPHAYARRARHHRVDGVVALAVDDAEDPELRKLLASGTPVVAVDLVVAGEHASYVVSDNLAGARLAVRHLHELGHRRIATIAGLSHTKPAADRLLGYRAELQELGLERRAEYEAQGDFYMQSGETAMRALLALPEPPTAVFAASDLMAVGALKAVEAAGLRCPGDVAIVGFDDIQLAENLTPPLTTIRQDKRGVGAAAARSLVQMIDDPQASPPVLHAPGRAGRPRVLRRLGRGAGDAGASQALDLVRVEAPVDEHLVGVLAGDRRRALNASGRTREARGRAGLDDSRHVDERAARPMVLVLHGFVERQNRSDARVRPLEHGGPLVTRALAEPRGEHLPRLRPRAAVVLASERQLFRERQQLDELGVELAARAARPRGTRRRRTRRPRRTARRRRAGSFPAARAEPAAARPWKGVIMLAAPSTMAASTTWPTPLLPTSSRAATTPSARNAPPPPKSPSRLIGGTGGSPSVPMCPSAPARAM